MTLRAVVVCAALISALPLAARADQAPPAIEHRAQGFTIVRQRDAQSPLLNVTLVVRAGLDRETLAQSGLAALVAETILQTPVDGTPLEDALTAHGGSMHFSVDPRDVRFSIESLPENQTVVLDLVRRAFSAPSFTPAVVRQARTVLLHRITDRQQVALDVGLEMLAHANATDANLGLPAFGIPASLAQLGASDTRTFFTTFYRQGGAYVSAAGAFSDDGLAALAAALPAGTTNAVPTPIASVHGVSHELVAHRDIPNPWLIAQYPAPSIESKDFGPMLVLSAFLQHTLSDIAQVPGLVSQSFASRAVGARYDYEGAQPNLTLYVDGGIGNPNRAFSTALSVANILAQTKLEGSIDEFKSSAAGDFAIGSTTLETRAWLAVIFAQNGDSPDYLTRALAAIASTTPADIQRVARMYLASPTIALVLPRDQG